MDLCSLQVNDRFRQVGQSTVQFASSVRTRRLPTGDGKSPPKKEKDMGKEVGWQRCAAPFTKTTAQQHIDCELATIVISPAPSSCPSSSMAVLCVSFGTSVALCQADSARTKVLPCTCVTLSRTSLCSAFRWGHTSCCGLRFALRIKRVRMSGSLSWELFRLLGTWTSAVLPLRICHSRTNAFFRSRRRMSDLKWVEGALSKLVAGKVCDYLRFSSDSSFAKRPLAPFRKSHVSLPTSALGASKQADICRKRCSLKFDGLAVRVAF